ncbi:hypothetical protein PVAP13_4NG221909 [Panicum virgatum]|uniref:Uncharacterized protein n=1 Tax=Panicum virgatum TaxID=38727 RepID=A0A8T0TCF4_PANVG|nr:hypothetical protein PVAP13_4NG221909 [Panicum virgatum]
MSSVSPKKTPLLDKEESRNRGMNQGLEDSGGGGFSWLTALGFAFLTFNSGMAIYRSDGDRGAVAFVVASYLDLVLLFACLRIFERTPRESPRRGVLKACVWGLTTLLTVMFSHKVAAIMPPLVALASTPSSSTWTRPPSWRRRGTCECCRRARWRLLTGRWEML